MYKVQDYIMHKVQDYIMYKVQDYGSAFFIYSL